MTKIVARTAAMQLVDRGGLDLDVPVASVAPDLLPPTFADVTVGISPSTPPASPTHRRVGGYDRRASRHPISALSPRRCSPSSAGHDRRRAARPDTRTSARDRVQGPVELTVPGAVQAAVDDGAGGGFDRCDTGGLGEGAFASDPAGMEPRHDELRIGDGADAHRWSRWGQYWRRGPGAGSQARVPPALRPGPGGRWCAGP
jgi:hypothetical protein